MNSYIGHSSFLNGANATFVAELYANYLDQPDSVDPEWGEFFATLHDDARALLEDLRGASWAPRDARVIGEHRGNGAHPGNGHATHGANGAPLNGAPLSYGAASDDHAAPDQVRRATLDSIRALMLIRAYRVRGHLEARLDAAAHRRHRRLRHVQRDHRAGDAAAEPEEVSATPGNGGSERRKYGVWDDPA